MSHRLGRITTVAATERPDLLGEPVRAALAGPLAQLADQVGVTEIDPGLADTAAFNAAYEIPPEASVNCVVVAGTRAGEERIAALMVRADTRADVNGVVRKQLDVRKCSFLAHERAVTESGMEHGGITPIGLPATWRLLVDARATESELVVIGSGLRRSKLLLPGGLLEQLSGAEVVQELAT
jgi:prolyl-tRNA editing enzyme YbaK/EbsC (Cys-tRNA(Pro) deacylase)